MLRKIKSAVFALMSPKQRFRHIYRTHQWKSAESVSGPGSGMAATAALREALPGLVREIGATSILDLPCGDFNWMRHVVLELPDIRYIGMDIVPELIAENNERYATDRIRFLEGSAVTDELPKADLIVSRDFFIHLSFRDTEAAMARFRTASKYLLANTYPAIAENTNIVTGRWRFINLALPPYRFTNPVKKISETEPGKEMWLWKLGGG